MNYPKKSVGHLLKTPQMKYWFMDQHRSTHGVQKINLPVAEDLLNQNFGVEKPNTAWVSDITSIPTSEGWLYPVVILNRHKSCMA